ncbi:diguanylate cyclase domain-containing protein [Bacillus sp. FJAT-27231]|uniref:diguanylate cyclase domain-containing protein n=1 Tax=Bacillus sp. FJAT-27231 TaxID=1679168 RepID=UPI000670D4E0|nr:diguanylate cyclase [Bacillus sp. FJAT-27231]
MFLNRIVHLFQISSLKGRLRFWFICFTVVFVLLASIPLVIIERSQKREEANVAIEKTMNLQQLVIDNWFEDRLADIKSISELPTVKAGDIAKMEGALKAVDKNHPEFSGIVYVNKNGITEVDTTGLIGLDLSDRPYFKEAKKGKIFITDVLIGRQSNKPIIIFSVPVYNEAGHFQGLVFGPVPIKTINNIMRQYQDSSRETYLVERNGMLISESRQGKIGKNIKSEIYKQALAGSNIKSQFYTAPNGETVLGDYRWVHDNQWLIIGEITESKIYESFYHMVMIFSFVILLVIIIGYILMIWVSNQVEAPIRKVLIGTRKIGQGNYEYRLDKTSYKEDARELQELCDNFNSMGELIESHIDSIAKSEERFRMIADYSSDVITIHDSSGKYLYVSPAGKEILQYEDEEVIGHDSYLFIHPDDIEMIKENHQILFDTGYVVSTYRIRRKDGEYIWFESSIKSLQGKDPEEPQLIVISRNITERKLAEQRLEEANKILHDLSAKDGLTGVWNRRTFDEKLEIEWSRALRNSTSFSLIMLDIDSFKAYNDTYGHQAGDDCLRKAAAKISDVVIEFGGMIFRYGGEEFSVVLPETDHDGVQRAAETIRHAVEDLKIPHSGSQISQYVTISLGTVTVIPTKDEHTNQFIEFADKALYKAKQDGRNRVKSYNDLSNLQICGE